MRNKGENNKKKCDNKIYVIFYFNYFSDAWDRKG